MSATEFIPISKNEVIASLPRKVNLGSEWRDGMEFRNVQKAIYGRFVEPFTRTLAYELIKAGREKVCILQGQTYQEGQDASQIQEITLGGFVRYQWNGSMREDLQIIEHDGFDYEAFTDGDGQFCSGGGSDKIYIFIDERKTTRNVGAAVQAQSVDQKQTIISQRTTTHQLTSYYNPETGKTILKNGPIYMRLLKSYSAQDLVRK